MREIRRADDHTPALSASWAEPAAPCDRRRYQSHADVAEETSPILLESVTHEQCLAIEPCIVDAGLSERLADGSRRAGDHLGTHLIARRADQLFRVLDGPLTKQVQLFVVKPRRDTAVAHGVLDESFG